MQKVLQEANNLTHTEKIKLGEVLNLYENVLDRSSNNVSGHDYRTILKDDVPQSLQNNSFQVNKFHEKKFKLELDRLKILKVVKNRVGLALKEVSLSQNLRHQRKTLKN